MTAAIALLRAVNVGGNNKLAMADLRKLGETLGFENVRTLLQSGNLVFTTEAAADAALEKALESAARETLGLDTDFIVRTAFEWAAMIEANPFADAAKRDPGHLVVVALKAEPNPASVDALRSTITGPERIEAIGKTLFATYPDGIGRSKLTMPLIEKKLGTRGTGRNWNTVLKLAALAAE